MDLVNIAALIDAAATEDPARAAIIDEAGHATSYADLRDQVMRWAATLAARGVGRGDRVALVEWGGLRSTAVTLAAAHLGAATAQMNPLLTESEIAALVDAAGCGPGIITTDAEPDATLTAADAPARVDEDTLDAIVLFTSGTTGLPKPVPITHGSILARLTAYRQPFDASRPPATTIMCVPSFHVGGMLGLIMTLYAGDTTVIQARFDAGRWLELVSRHRIASVFLVPTMLARILDHPDFESTDLSALRVISYGAAAAPGALIERAMAALPHVGFANVFGQTETLGAYTTLGPDDHRDPRRIGSVGRPLPGVELRIVDPDTEADLAIGEVGEIWMKGSQNVRGGWLHTGDWGRLDGDGYLFPAGRRSDTINRGGEKFGPVEVATVLAEHPAVAEVAVAGVPDDEMGERVGVIVVVEEGRTAPTTADLREWSRDRLAAYKLPEIVVFADALPINELGKLPRRAIVELIVSQRTEQRAEAREEQPS
jgi:acyl-CoA synthetase (AMP-forming)/AMP-acid ligase II